MTLFHIAVLQNFSCITKLFYHLSITSPFPPPPQLWKLPFYPLVYAFDSFRFHVQGQQNLSFCVWCSSLCEEPQHDVFQVQGWTSHFPPIFYIHTCFTVPFHKYTRWLVFQDYCLWHWTSSPGTPGMVTTQKKRQNLPHLLARTLTIGIWKTCL